MNTKQIPVNITLTKLITNTIRLPVGTIAKLSDKNYLHNRTEASGLKLKHPTNLNKTKAFNKQFTNITCSQDKINRYIGHKIKIKNLLHPLHLHFLNTHSDPQSN